MVSWGHPDYSGDSSEVQDQLSNVQQIFCTEFAFAVILADETVVTWGHPSYGGDSSEVQDQLRNVHLGSRLDACQVQLGPAYLYVFRASVRSSCWLIISFGAAEQAVSGHFLAYLQSNFFRFHILSEYFHPPKIQCTQCWGPKNEYIIIFPIT